MRVSDLLLRPTNPAAWGQVYPSPVAPEATKPAPKGGTVNCNLGDLANGTSASITIVVTPTRPGTLANTATVSGNETDPNPLNNSATATTTVIGT